MGSLGEVWTVPVDNVFLLSFLIVSLISVCNKTRIDPASDFAVRFTTDLPSNLFFRCYSDCRDEPWITLYRNTTPPEMVQPPMMNREPIFSLVYERSDNGFGFYCDLRDQPAARSDVIALTVSCK